MRLYLVWTVWRTQHGTGCYRSNLWWTCKGWWKVLHLRCRGWNHCSRRKRSTRSRYAAWHRKWSICSSNLWRGWSWHSQVQPLRLHRNQCNRGTRSCMGWRCTSGCNLRYCFRRSVHLWCLRWRESWRISRRYCYSRTRSYRRSSRRYRSNLQRCRLDRQGDLLCLRKGTRWRWRSTRNCRCSCTGSWFCTEGSNLHYYRYRQVCLRSLRHKSGLQDHPRWSCMGWRRRNHSCRLR